MKHLLPAFFLSFWLVQLTSCVREEPFVNSPEGNFDVLWKIIDEQYCFLEYKEIDWDEIYRAYKEKISPEMEEWELFNVLSDMLNELKDGHVNLISEEYISGYDGWLNGYPRNFNMGIQSNYLGEDFLEVGDALCQIFPSTLTGYLYIPTFTSTIDYADLQQIFTYFSNCEALIIDIRDNGGGAITNASRIASCFTRKKVLTGYLQHKTGKGRGDFSEPRAVYLEPSSKVFWNKPTAVLTNRQAYSAANYFICIIKDLPKVTVIGDTTGGGSGLPFSSELPNGWRVRYSTSPHYDIYMNHIEFGIEPEIEVDMTKEDESKGKDTIIETAIQHLQEQFP